MNNVNKIALILSFIFPGFGQIWNREYIKGINLILLQIIFIIILFYPGSNLFPVSMVAIPMLWIWGMVDASRIYHVYLSEHRRVQKRRNIQITLGIIAFFILSEAIFVPTTLTIRRNYNTSSNDTSLNAPSISGSSTSVDDKKEPGDNNAYSSSSMPDDFEAKHMEHPDEDGKQLQPSAPANEDIFQSSEQVSPEPQDEVVGERSEHPWVVTVSVSEKHNEISKLYHELRKKYQVQIIPVSSNPQHNAFAVAITGFATILDAENIANELRKDIPECFVASYENPAIPVK